MPAGIATANAAEAAEKIGAPTPIHSFLSSSRLAMKLAKNGVIELADEQAAIRIVHRLRQRLNRTKTRRRLTGGSRTVAASFAYRLVHREPVLGYGLSLAAAKVSLTIASRELPSDLGDAM